MTRGFQAGLGSQKDKSLEEVKDVSTFFLDWVRAAAFWTNLQVVDWFLLWRTQKEIKPKICLSRSVAEIKGFTLTVNFLHLQYKVQILNKNDSEIFGWGLNVVNKFFMIRFFFFVSRPTSDLYIPCLYKRTVTLYDCVYYICRLQISLNRIVQLSAAALMHCCLVSCESFQLRHRRQYPRGNCLHMHLLCNNCVQCF